MLESDLRAAETQEIDSLSFDEGLLVRSTEVHPYVVYALLRDILGEPASEFNDDEEWSWCIKLVDGYIYAYGYDDSWSSRVFSSDHIEAKRIGNEFIAFLKKHKSKYLSRLRKLPAVGYEFQNPFSIYFDNANKLLARAETLGEELDYRYPGEERTAFLQSAFFLYVAALEGFLNLIYELYLIPSLRDDRIYSRLAREQIDIKVRLAPMYCVCFNSHVIDHRNEVFQRFQYITDLRNDFIHANLTKPMRTTLVRERTHQFTVEHEPDGKYGLPRNPTSLKVDNLRFVRDTVSEMAKLIIENMKPRFRHEIAPVLYDVGIYVELVDDEYIVIS